jgi:hypothetical protein
MEKMTIDIMRQKMRKRYRKVFVHNHSHMRDKKNKLIKGEYVTNFDFFKKNRISRLLWGKCLVFEGIEPSGWNPRKDDLIVSTEVYLSRKEIHRLNIIANSIGKELFVFFSWGPKGLGSVIFSIIVETLTEILIKKIFKVIFKEKEYFKIKNICVKNMKGKQYLEIMDNNDNIYEFVINKKVNNLEEKVFNAIDSLSIPYNYGEIDKTKLIYDRHGTKIDYDIEGKMINIES